MSGIDSKLVSRRNLAWSTLLWVASVVKGSVALDFKASGTGGEYLDARKLGVVIGDSPGQLLFQG